MGIGKIGLVFVGAASVFLAPGCTASITRPDPPPLSVSSPGPSEPEVLEGDPIRLELDLRERALGWERIAFVPFGSARDALGLSACFHCEVVGPRTIAIGNNGSIWISDNFKRRLLHLDPSGRFLGEVRFSGALKVRDLEPLGRHLVALLDYGRLVELNAGGKVVERGSVRHRGARVWLYRLFIAEGRLFAHSFGTDANQGPKGLVEVTDIANGIVDAVVGLPMSPSSSLRVDLRGHGRRRWYRVAATSSKGTLMHRVRVKPRGPAPPKGFLVDAELQGVVPGRAIVGLSPLTGPWYDPEQLGYWLVVLNEGAQPVASERIAIAGEPIGDLVVAEDGRVYRMLYRDGGLVIERRRP